MSDFNYGRDGTPLLLMDWKDMCWEQRVTFVLDILCLCSPVLGVLLAIVGMVLNRMGLI